ncbi:molybdenum cofactor sulfurase-like [Tubulanus polymorphus]|uniref:molybdenum cofactor sulfurase-like n=1 Tax=Tubulanus polymorphus TaxID=672921 RepID=UPI003DA666F3
MSITTRLSDEFDQIKDVTYLDHVGATLYSRRQIEAYQKDLLENLYGNTHSSSLSGLNTANTVDQVRERILRHFRTSSEEYSVIFTSGCTAALKLLAETFNFAASPNNGNGRRLARAKDGSQTLATAGGTSNDSETFRRCNGRHFSESSSQSVRQCDQNGVDTRGDRFCDKNRATMRQNDRSAKIRCEGDCDENGMNIRMNDASCDENCFGTGAFLYTQDTHTSVLGMREIAAAKRASIYYMPYGEFLAASEKLDSDGAIDLNAVPLTSDGTRGAVNGACGIPQRSNGLFVYPASSNFNGQKYSLRFTHRGFPGVTRGIPGGVRGIPGGVNRWYVCLDAASFVSTNRLDLNKFKPDFVALSFYKIFGFPTGLGALLVRNEIADESLQKTYFGGGTVLVSLATERFHVNRSAKIHERFEDGTLPFLDIIALNHGFDALDRIGGTMEAISTRISQLTKFVYDKLTALLHSNGQPVVRSYFDGPSLHGNVINFNVLRDDGSYVGYSTVDKLAQLNDIHLRTGCFCNIGACQYFMGLSSDDIKSNYQAGHVCGDDMDLIDGRPTGSVRISFGYMSTAQDALNFISFVEKCFVQENSSNKHEVLSELIVKDDSSVIQMDSQEVESHEVVSSKPTERSRSQPTEILQPADGSRSRPWLDGSGDYWRVMEDQSTAPLNLEENADENILTNIILYPVKSCAGFQVASWQIGSRGLLYDRRWMIVNKAGVCLSQKRAPQLCLIQPYIDAEQRILVLAKPGMPNLCVPFGGDFYRNDKVHATLCRAKVCGDGVNGIDLGEQAGEWVSDALGQSGCRLIQQHTDDNRSTRHTTDGQLSLANQSQFLLINQTSAKHLLEAINKQNATTTDEIDLSNLLSRFRANFIISGGNSPFAEDSWSDIKIGSHKFHSEGRCNRCQMICIDQSSAEKNQTPLLTLTTINDKKMKFGIYLKHTGCVNGGAQNLKIRIGDAVRLSTSTGD